jgi:pyruvate/2-oxoglutarate/acetoin dehydrogenase E1 component|tara:strand:- start:25409 stop:25948 length:540 start_codon:yes stop_codon:yes gene_type:complete
MGKYFEEIQRAMTYLGQQPDTVFLGQAVEYAGTAMTNTLKEVSRDKLLEMPVNEEMQMGITNGLAIGGLVPISIYPRWNFLILAANQLVNHLDKYSIYTDGEFAPKAIIRVGVGSNRPLNPQIQHVGDFTKGFEHMLDTIEIIRLKEPEDVFPAYYKAYNRIDGRSTILVEWGDFYHEK